MTNNLYNEVYGRDGTATYYPKPSAQLVNLVQGKKLNRGRALDLGCGDGRNAIFLASVGYEVYALDLSSVAIDKLRTLAAQRSLPNIRAGVADMRLVRYPEAFFDLIIANTTLDNLTRPDAYAIIKRIKDWTAPHGYIYASVFTVDDPAATAQPDSEAVSETAASVQTFFQRCELLECFSEFNTVSYTENIEDDLTHGAPHKHGVARLICQLVPRNI